MRALLFVSASLLSFSVFSRSLHYEISPLFGGETLRLQVNLRFAGNTGGETELAVPTQFGGAGHLFRCIRDLRCTTPGARLRIDADTLFATLVHRAGEELTLSYTLVQDFPGSAVEGDRAFRPLLQASYFHVLGNTLFVAPKWNETYEVSVDWRGFPPGWRLHGSVAPGETPRHFASPDLRWLESVFAGGDYRLHRAEIRGKPLWMAVRGREWGFSDDSLFSMLVRTVTLQREFWQDFDAPFYSVVLTPLASRPVAAAGQVFVSTRISYLGTGLQHAFTAFATPHKLLEVKDLHHLFHHELMHEWIGGRIRNGCAGNDMQMAWFSEGFTEYFALKNMLKGGFLSAEQYMDRLNERIFRGLYRSPLREAPNSMVAARFFLDPEVETLPYQRGCVFAFFLDNAIKAGSAGQRNLHGLMIELLAYYDLPGRDLHGNFDFFLESCADYLKQDAEMLYRKHIVSGQLIPATAFALPPYLKMETDENGAPFFWLDKTVNGWGQIGE